MDSMVVHNFKSFRHANIKFIKGFNCILGPNGSGKSNIWDALMFALGESSLRRLRVTKASELINVGAKGKNGVSKAYVKLIFSGEKQFEIMRAIKSNGKVAYKLDGRRARRQDVIDALRTYRCYANETNTIAQGEIVYMEKLNPKGRRELIDAASGIKEFDEKRGASMKELDRVEQGIREAGIELDLKRGFLLDIEQQKSDAERYLALKDFISRGTLALLAHREVEARRQHAEYASKAVAIEQSISDLRGFLLEIESRISKLSLEKGTYSRELNDKSLATGSVGKRIDHIERELAVNESRLQSIEAHIRERAESVKSSEEEIKNISRSKEALKLKVAELRTELDSKIAQLGGRSIEDILKAGVGEADVLEALEKNQEEIISAQKILYENEAQTARFDAELQSAKVEVERLDMEASNTRQKTTVYAQKLAALEFELKAVVSHRDAAESKILGIGRDIEKYRKSIDDMDARRLKLREQIAMSGGSERKSDDALRHSVKRGFYGRAYSLCTYSKDYATAIAAASSGRLSYFVVDSPEIADEAISVLKEHKLGRASFIPLVGVISKASKAQGLESLISHVKFDSKFSPAFDYIFSDTYIVESIAVAKRIGFGKHRYVTLEGELIERSGVVSGGSMGQRISVQLLEPQLASLELERTAASTALSECELIASKMRSELSDMASKEYEIKFELQRTEESLKIDESKLAALLESSKRRAGEIGDLESKRNANESKIAQLKEKIAHKVSENERMSKARGSASKTRMSSEDIEHYRRISSAAESIKVTIAEVSKEIEMGEKRIEDINKAISSMSQQSESERKECAVASKAIKELTAAKLELQEELKKHGDKYGDLVSKIQALDASISSAAEEKCKKTSELSRRERDQMEAGMRAAQLQVRLSDLKAEIAAYGNIEPLKSFDMNTIEREISNSKLEVERLGAVNLKAPEVYGEKTAEVAAATQKLDVLNREKDSIIKMISEIDGRKLSVFSQTFKEVNEKFKELYSYVFDGNAHLDLDDQKDQLSAGLHIVISSGRNKNILVEQHSGGEKSLVMLMLLFAIQTRSPMSFYLFDEVDGALDKENAKKLSGLIKELGKSSQMIVVSHKDAMVTQADSAIGVVRKEGESKAVGLIAKLA